MSAGAVLLAMGTEGYRFSAPNATILLHDVSSGTQGKINDMKIEVAEADRLNNLLFTLMARSVGKPPKFFLDMLANTAHVDLYMTAVKAKSLNIVNHTRLPSIKLKVKTEMVLE